MYLNTNSLQHIHQSDHSVPHCIAVQKSNMELNPSQNSFYAVLLYSLIFFMWSLNTTILCGAQNSVPMLERKLDVFLMKVHYPLNIQNMYTVHEYE